MNISLCILAFTSSYIKVNNVSINDLWINGCRMKKCSTIYSCWLFLSSMSFFWFLLLLFLLFSFVIFSFYFFWISFLFTSPFSLSFFLCDFIFHIFFLSFCFLPSFLPLFYDSIYFPFPPIFISFFEIFSSFSIYFLLPSLFFVCFHFLSQYDVTKIFSSSVVKRSILLLLDIPFSHNIAFI